MSSKGAVPRDFNIDPSGNFLLAANQDSDNIAVFRINSETGLLTDTQYSFDVETPVSIEFRTKTF